MSTLRSARPFLASLLGLALAAGGCSTATEGELNTFAGEWCTLRGLGNNDLPLPGVAYVAATLIEDGTRVLGTGSVSRPDSDSIYPARYRGDVAGGVATIEVSDLDETTENPGPRFTLRLETEGVRDLVGTMSGDPDFTGSITLVRLGPRCFAS